MIEQTDMRTDAQMYGLTKRQPNIFGLLLINLRPYSVVFNNIYDLLSILIGQQPLEPVGNICFSLFPLSMQFKLLSWNCIIKKNLVQVQLSCLCRF